MSDDEIDISAALIVGVTLGIIVSYITYKYLKLRHWSALTVGLLALYAIINLMYPIGLLMYERRSYIIVIYLLIEIGIPVYLFLYFIKILLSDTYDCIDLDINEMTNLAYRKPPKDVDIVKKMDS
jgi:glucan phosphoethanolaminetransferase (alkaline phosphatase superfamily)